ncbi:TPA: hypothetical protein ACX6S1_002347 [Photobacterium damselae]
MSSTTLRTYINEHPHAPLLFISYDGQLLGRYDPPISGWNIKTLTEKLTLHHQQCFGVSCDAFLGETQITSF